LIVEKMLREQEEKRRKKEVSRLVPEKMPPNVNQLQMPLLEIHPKKKKKKSKLP